MDNLKNNNKNTIVQEIKLDKEIQNFLEIHYTTSTIGNFIQYYRI